jgi:hypothetical protein
MTFPHPRRLFKAIGLKQGAVAPGHLLLDAAEPVWIPRTALSTPVADSGNGSATKRAQRRQAAEGAARRSPAVPAALAHALTLRRVRRIIFCCLTQLKEIFSDPEEVPMTLSKKLGLTLFAAALATTYGCGKEEPKKPTPQGSRGAAADDVVVVKIGHAGPLTGGIAHLGKDDENGARLASTKPPLAR